MLNLAPEDGLSGYFRRIDKYPLLSAERERELARRWRQRKDARAGELLTGSHLRLVVKIARGFTGYDVPFADLISQGNLGLMQAAHKFEPARGVRFATYATWWIRAAILEYVMRSASMVRLATTARQKKLFFNLRRLKAARGELAEHGMSAESATSIAHEVGASEAEVLAMNARLSGGDSSLNVTLGGDGGAMWQDLLVDEAADPEAQLAERDELAKRRALLSGALRNLTERERDIVGQRRLAEDRPTLETLGQKYNVSRERIRQIEEEAVAKLGRAVRAAAVH